LVFSEWVQQLIQKYHASGLVVDTNLLLMYLVGLCDPSLIPKFKRTQTFIPEDFVLLHAFLERFSKVITTPGILTEVNSLANQLQERNKPAFFEVFRSRIALLDERHSPSRDLTGHVYFGQCGLTDSAIMTVAERGLLVLTDDLRLTVFLSRLNIEYLNFNHIRFVPG
jgi:hypothetical protein